MRVRARIKFFVIDGLHADNGGDAENVVRAWSRARRPRRAGPGRAESGRRRWRGRRCWTSLLAMLPELRSGKISTFARPATLLSGSLRAAISGTSAASTCNSPSKSASRNICSALRRASGGGRLHLADGRMGRAALGGKGQQRHARPHAEHVARKLRGGNGDVGQLIHGRFGNDAAIGHEQHAVLAEARVLDFHHHATRRRGDAGRDLDDLEQRPQHAAGDVGGAGNQAVGLVHRQHHGAEIIRLQHGLARLRRFDPLFPAQPEKAVGEIVQFLALGGLMMRMPSSGIFSPSATALIFAAVTEHDGRAQPQRIKLPGRLQDARFLAFGKTTRLGCRCNFSMTLPMKRMATG